jgi:tetratricopeptide (TPR) repeat protein
VEILFGDGEKEERDFAYADAMRQLAETYANDPNAASFYALALLGACHRGRDFRIYMKAAAVLEEVLDKNPEHPGALHYLIHSYDDPIHAPLGLRAARVYAKIAPAAAHALHMSSHIFVAMGMWDDVVASNEASWAASEARVTGKNLPLEDRGYHSLWWLEYAYLQQGRFADALRTLKIMQQDVKTSPSRLIAFHLLQMCTAYAIETGTPCSPPSGIVTSDLDLPAAAALFANGMISLNRGERADAESSLAGLRKLREVAQGDPSSGQAAHHNHLYAGDREAVAIMEKELQALLLMEDGHSKEAIELMIEATSAEDRTSFDFGPPLPPKPSHELFGELLLRLGQPDAAREQFEMALIRAPKRALSLLGLSRALTEMGDKTAARKTLTELRTMWRRADKELQEAVDQSLAQL